MTDYEVSLPSRPFGAKFNSKASWSGEWVDKGQRIRRWEINGEETYEPVSLTEVISKLGEGRSGKVKDADHALELLKEFGNKVFFVTKINKSSLDTNKAKIINDGIIRSSGSEWSEKQFKIYIGRHAKFFILRDDVTLKSDKEIIRERANSFERRTKEEVLDFLKYKVDKEDLDVTDEEIEEIVNDIDFKN